MASWLDGQIEAIRQATAEGRSAAAIARDLGCSATLVRQAMQRHGIDRLQPGTRIGTTKQRPARLDIHADQIREWTAQGWRMGRIAAELDCSKQAVHHAMKRHGIERHPPHSNPGELNPAWRGGRYFDGHGYVLIHAPEHPFATQAARVPEHRLVMEQQLGRFLLPTEVVDHIDGNRSNNCPSNLRVFASNAEHLQATLSGRSRSPGLPSEDRQPDATPAE